MVLEVGGLLYYGADAMHVLALISGRSGVFNWLILWILRSETQSQLLYPVFRALRNLLL